MNRQLIAICGLAAACIFSIAHSQDLKLRRGTVCWPLHFSGITLGVTNDSEVQRLLGNGVSRKGDTGGRYFIDEGHTATLHVVQDTGYAVTELTLQIGVDPAIRANELNQAESKWFKPAEGFGKWHSLHLGSSRDEVIKNLGEPKKRVALDDWRYETVCQCELPEFFDVFFKGNRVVKVVFSSPGE